MNIRNIGKQFVFCMLLVISLSAVALAQNDPVTLTVSPPLFELSANPGDTLKNTVRLENPTDKATEVFIDFRNFTAYGEEGSVDLTENATNYSLADWLSIDSSQTIIPPNGSRTFNFKVNIPANAEPGGHFGSIVFKTKVSDPVEGSGAKVEQELGSLLLVKVAGNIKESIAIESFSPAKNLWEKGPVALDARLKNNGNAHIKPTGTITINNILGKQIASVPMDEKNILPGAIRKITTNWRPSGFTMGRFTANLTVVYGGDNQIANSSTTFWVIPYKLLAVVGLVAGILAFAFVKYRKRISAALKVLRGKH